MCAARAASSRPASVNTKRRDVRLISRVANRASLLLPAFEIVALDSFSSAAARAKEGDSATFAKMASPSRSASLDITHQNSKHLISTVSLSTSHLLLYFASLLHS